MTKIRKIIEKYSDIEYTVEGYSGLECIIASQYDKLEKELQELFDSIKYKKKRFNTVNDVIGINKTGNTKS